MRKGVLENFTKFSRKQQYQSLFSNNVEGLTPATLLKKKTLTQLFSYEFCKIFKNISFTKHLRTTASVKLCNFPVSRSIVATQHANYGPKTSSKITKKKILFIVWHVAEAVSQMCSVKKVFLKISQNSEENTCVRVSFSIKLPDYQVCNFIRKETLPQVFSCEFYKIFKNTFFYRPPLVAASNISFLNQK